MSFGALVPSRLTVDHTDANYVCLRGQNSSTVVTGLGQNYPFPNLSFQSNVTVANGITTIPAGGNRTTRIYGDVNINRLLNPRALLTAPKYKCLFVAMKILRRVSNTAVTAAERLFQNGRQGSGPSPNDGGGIVARINFGSVSPFLTKSVSFAIHTDYLASDPKNNYGSGQSDPNFPDPIATTGVFSDADWNAGISFIFAVDCSVSPFAARIYANGVHNVSAAQNPLALASYPPPVADNWGAPANNSVSGGFVLFAQSTNQDAALLKDSDVWPIYIGEARDTSHLAAIAAAHHASPLTNPYSRA